ncbi:MAG: CvpA family protein [Desulfohalobiaceae bacterium]
MNILDGIFIIILLLSFFRGIIKGLIKEVAFVAALVLAFLGASSGYPPLNIHMKQIIPDPEIAATVSYVLVFFAVFLIVLFVGVSFRYMLQGLMLGWLDRLGGGALGVFKGALVCSLIILLLMTVFSQDAKILNTSRVAPHMMRITGRMSSYIPEHYKEKFQEIAEDLQDTWEDGDMSRWLDSDEE